MKKILGSPKTIRELFTGVKYSIHYYQREYQWKRKQVEELIEDLTSEFLNHYEHGHERDAVEHYGHYFMGSVVLTEEQNAIIDGQQRLTSLSLLLLYISKHLVDEDDKTEVLNLIFSKKYGKKTFNIDVTERNDCLEAIMEERDFDPTGNPESVQNIWRRYQDIEGLMIDALEHSALPFFKDWLIDNVQFIRIVAQTEQDAHKIFVSMNDRGLSLTAAEMLKGYLLSEISDDSVREKANDKWKERILELKSLGKEEESDCIKTWLRSQYAESIRERKKNAKPGDFDDISTAFHKWVRENAQKIGLEKSKHFADFVQDEFIQFSSIYMRILKYSNSLTKGFEHIFYNANRNFTLQPLLLMASISRGDSTDEIDAKLRVVSIYLDQLMSVRIFNYKTLDYSAMAYFIFQQSKKLRGKSAQKLAYMLTHDIRNYEYNLDAISDFHLNGWSKRYMLHQLARITHFIEQESGRDTVFEKYVDRKIKNPYDIEHIWADHYDRFEEEIDSEDEFNRIRNRFGDLLILPQDINRSLNDANYQSKVSKYYAQNLLAASLSDSCYENNPQFRRFIEASGLSFTSEEEFTKESIERRQNLYGEISKMIWDPERIKDSIKENLF